MTDLTQLAYTRKQAAAACGVEVETISKAIHSGALRAKWSAKGKKGEGRGSYLITRAALEAWLDSLVDA